MTRRTAAGLLGAIGIAVLTAACGGSDGGSTPAPTPTPPPTTPPVATTTITITSAGASPRDITVTVGSRVTFVNNDSIGHDMNSDPHPAHTDCLEINLGNVPAGQSRATGNLNTARTCRYHDHNQPSNANLQGTIRIQ